jgi:hypothetical protein
MPNADYHDQPHIGSSGFKLLARSPLHFWTASALNPERERKEPTRLMQIGTAWHTGIWEPDLFDGLYGVKPDGFNGTTTVGKLLDIALGDLPAFEAQHVAIPDGLSKASKAGKELLAELEAQGKTGVEETKLAQVLQHARELVGKTLFNADDMASIKAMSKAAHDHPVTQVIFNLPGGMAEQSIFWVDRQTGAPCRIRPDYAVPPCSMFPHGLIVDGKSNADSSPVEFAKNAWNSEMYFQAAFYSDGFQQHFGTDQPPVFAWLSQERDAPYATAYYSAPSDFVEYGRRRYRPLLALFAECLRTGQWPGYATTVQDLDLPAWAAKTLSEAA